jgi:hypothetical protein
VENADATSGLGRLMLCVAAAGTVVALAASSFSLSWTHSVEKTQWREAWLVLESRLQLVSARVEGPGAGIALPSDAVWADGAWTYQPTLAPVPELVLAASGATVSPWTLCQEGGACMLLGAEAGDPVRLWAADDCG